jgi:hypothetical protein
LTLEAPPDGGASFARPKSNLRQNYAALELCGESGRLIKISHLAVAGSVGAFNFASPRYSYAFISSGCALLSCGIEPRDRRPALLDLCEKSASEPHQQKVICIFAILLLPASTTFIIIYFPFSPLFFHSFFFMFVSFFLLININKCAASNSSGCAR